MQEIKNVHDNLFKVVFGNVDNTRAFLNKALPETRCNLDEECV